MSRGRRAFRPSDVTAAMLAVEKAGKQVARVRIGPDGVVEVITGRPDEPDLDTGVSDENVVESFRNALRSKKNDQRPPKRRSPD